MCEGENIKEWCRRFWNVSYKRIGPEMRSQCVVGQTSIIHVECLRSEYTDFLDAFRGY